MKLKYRKDIDGMRALAILGVIIYHAELFIGQHKLLPGGYLGVDVFFVISGFFDNVNNSQRDTPHRKVFIPEFL